MKAIELTPTYILVRQFVSRASREYGIERQDIADQLGIEAPNISNWSADSKQARIPMEQIPAFAKAVKMNDAELAYLVMACLFEREGKKITINMDVLSATFAHFLVPSPSEQKVLQTYREHTAALPFDPLEAPAAQAHLNRAFSNLVDLSIERH